MFMINIFIAIIMYYGVFWLQAVESTIGNHSYQHNKINQWMSNIVESSLSQLTKLGKPFKYIGMVTGNLNNNNT